MRFMIHLLTAFMLALLVSCQTTRPGNFLGFEPNDTSLTTSVNETLMNHPDLSRFNFHVETREGVVYLSGYVKTIKQSDIAGDVAGKVPGVKQVENNIIVRK